MELPSCSYLLSGSSIECKFFIFIDLARFSLNLSLGISHFCCCEEKGMSFYWLSFRKAIDFLHITFVNYLVEFPDCLQ